MAGISDHYEAVLSVDLAGVWNPAAGAYAYALERCRVDPLNAMLVAAQSWNVNGAARVGPSTA